MPERSGRERDHALRSSGDANLGMPLPRGWASLVSVNGVPFSFCSVELRP